MHLLRTAAGAEEFEGSGRDGKPTGWSAEVGWVLAELALVCSLEETLETMRGVGRPEKTGRQSPTSEALGRFAPQERSAVLSSIRATGATAGPPLVRAVRAAPVLGDIAK